MQYIYLFFYHVCKQSLTVNAQVVHKRGTLGMMVLRRKRKDQEKQCKKKKTSHYYWLFGQLRAPTKLATHSNPPAQWPKQSYATTAAVSTLSTTQLFPAHYYPFGWTGEFSFFFLPRFAECFSVVWLPLYGYNKFPASLVAKQISWINLKIFASCHSIVKQQAHIS